MKKQPLKLFFFDLETTGTKFWKNGIHQIAGAIVINGVVAEKFDFKVQPYPKCLIEKEALDIAGVTEEQILQYPLMQDVYNQIIEMLKKYVDKFDSKDKFHLVGYNNASFDNAFFRAFFVQNGDNFFGSWFWSDPIDCFILASDYFKHERFKFENFQQRTVAKYLGIKVDEKKLHNAEYDIWLCMEIYKAVSRPSKK